MSSWIRRWRSTSERPRQGTSERLRVQERAPTKEEKPKEKTPDANAPLRRLQLHQRCLYERVLPGDAFISAHVNRLQHGHYESDRLHEPALADVYFVSVHFVFHAQDHRSHRIRSAVIRVSVHGDTDPADRIHERWYGPPTSHPRILGHAPELMYGAISPENLQWNFSLSSSLGVAQAPVAATLNPSGGVQRNYKVYDMMSIQGSLRSIQSPLGPKYDAEDAMAVWTLEENLLQRSGLPREFDFVLLVHKPDHVKNVYLSVDVDTRIEAWYGEYPQWYQNLDKYMPIQDRTIDLNTDIGQKFLPVHPQKGFNFATLPHPLEEYVAMPGTTYPTNSLSKPDGSNPQGPTPLDRLWPGQDPTQPMLSPPQQPYNPTRGQRDLMQAFTANRHSLIPDTINVRVTLEQPVPRSPSLHRYPGSPMSSQDPARHHSIRRKRSRPELKGFGAQQQLQEIARNTLNGHAR